MFLMFCIMCPKSPSLIAWIIERALDSTMAWDIPNSKESSTPSCNAKASVISAEKGAGRTLLHAGMREPQQSRIATPMHEGLPSEATPSVLILKKTKGRACQAAGEGAGENAGRVQAYLYSLSNLLAISQT